MLPIQSFLRHHPQAIAVAVAGTTLAALTATVLLRRRTTVQQREERRRIHLSLAGRIVDGTLIDIATVEEEDGRHRSLLYRYRISGVTYECGQDVSLLSGYVPGLATEALLLERPVQVRYDRQNPANSIIVSENWNGLWTQPDTLPR